MRFTHSLVVTSPAFWTMRCHLYLLDSPLPYVPRVSSQELPTALGLFRCGGV